MERNRIYISSPFTRGWQIHNIRRQCVMALELKKFGYNPFIPLLFVLFEFAVGQEFSEREMLDWELSFIPDCDALVRIRFKDERGIEIPSSGADEEVAMARKYGVPVYIFESMEEMITYFKYHTI